MTKLAMAREFAFDVHNDAEHAYRLSQDVRQALDDGNLDRALERLVEAEKPAGMLAARIAWAREAVEAARKEASSG